MIHDVAVIGLGAMGSAACYHLARRGQSVVGLDRFSPPHDRGSSAGESRIIRSAYHEGTRYVPLVQHAYELWAELEAEVGQQLFIRTGGLMIGAPSSEIFSGALLSAQTHGLAHDVLDPAELRRRFPVLGASEEMLALYEPTAGVLFPERCIDAHLRCAAASGAELRFAEQVQGWREEEGGGVTVSTQHGELRARRLLVSAGAWMPKLLADLSLPLVPTRQVLLWFEPASSPEAFLPASCPIYIWEVAPELGFYGFPDLGTGVKVARHYGGAVCDPDALDRADITAADEAELRALMTQFMPAANGRRLRGSVCMYTNTPDQHFLIDFHPRQPSVLLASPCSGHGFKFSSALGSVLADLLTTGKTSADLGLFGIGRLPEA